MFATKNTKDAEEIYYAIPHLYVKVPKHMWNFTVVAQGVVDTTSPRFFFGQNLKPFLVVLAPPLIVQ